MKRCHILEYLKEQDNLPVFNKIKEEIINLYDDRVFILKHGDLEDYLSISKDLTNVVSICQNDFNAWIVKEEAFGTASKVYELTTIFQKILT